MQGVGNDRFLHSASPVDTTKPARDDLGRGVWWPLALNDMPPECAQLIAKLHNLYVHAQGDEHYSNNVLENSILNGLSKDDPTTWVMKAELANVVASFWRELVEIAYVG